MECLNAAAHAQLFKDSDGEDKYSDFRILDGYDSYYEPLADGLDIRLGCVVREIDWTDGLRIGTESEEMYAADAAVVTLPLGVLQSDRVRFNPPLPRQKREALAGLKMGPVMKLVYLFDEPLLEPEIGAIYARANPPMWWSPTLGRDSGATVWTGFVTGDYAREMLALGEGAALQKGLETLREEIGQPTLQLPKRAGLIGLMIPLL